MMTRIPVRTNVSLSLAALGLHGLVLIALPLWLLPLGPAWLWLLALPALLSPLLWSLIHEAIHGLLHPRPRVNAALGRCLAIVFGAPLRPLRFAHLRHHRYNRTSIARDEVYEASRTPRWLAGSLHHLRLLGGLYLAEIALNLMVWLPRSVLARLAFLRPPPEWPHAAGPARRLAGRELLETSALREMRLDALLVLLVYGLAFWLFGPYWPALLVMLLARGLLVSALDNAYHHATPLVCSDSASAEAQLFALNLRAGPMLRALLLNMNLHRTHHRHVRLPWSALPAHADSHPADSGFWKGVARQWCGPLEVSELGQRTVVTRNGSADRG
jgi:fatty acid desaturase